MAYFIFLPMTIASIPRRAFSWSRGSDGLRSILSKADLASSVGFPDDFAFIPIFAIALIAAIWIVRSSLCTIFASGSIVELSPICPSPATAACLTSNALSVSASTSNRLHSGSSNALAILQADVFADVSVDRFISFLADTRQSMASASLNCKFPEWCAVAIRASVAAIFARVLSDLAATQRSVHSEIVWLDESASLLADPLDSLSDSSLRPFSMNFPENSCA